MPIQEPTLAQQILDWAAYLVAALSGLLYKLTRDKMKEDKDSYTRELTSFRSALDKCITKEDFTKHEEREDKDRDERRAAEKELFRLLEKLGDEVRSR